MLTENEAFLEELFKGCRKTMRVLRLFIQNPYEAYTKYRVEKEALVYDSEIILERLVKLGILKIVNKDPKLYKLVNDLSIVKALKAFFRETGYI